MLTRFVGGKDDLHDENMLMGLVALNAYLPLNLWADKRVQSKSTDLSMVVNYLFVISYVCWKF